MTDVSVVVPVYDAPDDYVSTCVTALLRQKSDALCYEIILVDDGSRERPVEDQLRRLGLVGHAQLKHIRIDHAGPATARNAGIETARGDLIALTDIDCIPNEDWLSRYAKAFGEGDLDAAGGLTTSHSTKTWVEKYCHHFGSLRAPLRRGDLLLLIACNACWRARTLRALGGFHHAYTRFAAAGLCFKGFEDFELSVRAARHGARVGVVDDAVVAHRHRRTVGGRMQQFASYGAGYAAFVELCPDPPEHLTRYSISPAAPTTSAIAETCRQLASLPVRVLGAEYACLPTTFRVGYGTIDLLQRVAFYGGFCHAARQVAALSQQAGVLDVGDRRRRTTEDGRLSSVRHLSRDVLKLEHPAADRAVLDWRCAESSRRREPAAARDAAARDDSRLSDIIRPLSAKDIGDASQTARVCSHAVRHQAGPNRSGRHELNGQGRAGRFQPCLR